MQHNYFGAVLTSPTIKLGASGPAVTEAKALLNKWLASKSKPTLAIVSVQFDADMDAATKAFQADKGLKADGIIGSMTWAALRDDKPKAAAAPVAPIPVPPALQVKPGIDKKKVAIVGGIVAAGVLAAILLKGRTRRNPKDDAADKIGNLLNFVRGKDDGKSESARRAYRRKRAIASARKKRQKSDYKYMREKVGRMGISPVGLTKEELRSILKTEGNRAASVSHKRDRVDADFRRR